MKKIYEYAHLWIKEYVKNDDIVVDFTMGNGNDTLELAKLVPNGRVYAFDVQKEAINKTKERLEKHNITNCELLLESHSAVDEYIQKFKAGIFNLGYLPAGNKSITTKTNTTKIAVMKAMDCLEVGGVLVIVVYPGHIEGKKESDMLNRFVKELDNHDYDVMRLSVENKRNSPYAIVIEKKRSIIS